MNAVYNLIEKPRSFEVVSFCLGDALRYVNVRLTRSARLAVWSEKESQRTVTDSCIPWRRPTELIAATVVRRTWTYNTQYIIRVREWFAAEIGNR